MISLDILFRMAISLAISYLIINKVWDIIGITKETKTKDIQNEIKNGDNHIKKLRYKTGIRAQLALATLRGSQGVIDNDSIADCSTDDLIIDNIIDNKSEKIEEVNSNIDVINSGANSYDIKQDYQLDVIIKQYVDLTKEEKEQLENNYHTNLNNINTNIGFKDNSVIIMIRHTDTIIVQLLLLLVNEKDLFGLSPKFNIIDIDLDTIILYNFSVNEEYRNRGYGKQILTLVEDWCIKNNKNHICLFVGKDNRPAINLFLKQQYAMIPYYTESGEIMMKKSLKMKI